MRLPLLKLGGTAGYLVLAVLTYVITTWFMRVPPSAEVGLRLAFSLGPVVLLVSVLAGTEWAKRRAGAR